MTAEPATPPPAPAGDDSGHEPAINVSGGYCRLHRAGLPSRYPVQPRPDLAVRRPLVVATRDGQQLLCSRDHPGPCLWPNGDEEGQWDDE